ncbi:MAG: four helix bundle protein [Chitinophagaceae bacterium]
MFLQLRHKKSALYSLSKKIVYDCYDLHQAINSPNRTEIGEQIKKAALIAHFNIAKGLYSKRRKKARKSFRLALNAYLVVDAGLEMVLELEWATIDELKKLDRQVQTAFDLLTVLKKK